MNNKIAIFAASCDPVTYGHLNIIERACNIFDKVFVAVGNNPNKQYTFPQEDRANFIAKCIPPGIAKKVEVIKFDGLLADVAYERGVKTIIKGVRTSQDFDYERMLHEITITQQIGIDTHILVSDQKLSHVSSSAVKEICKYQGLTHEYVPYCVKEALEWKLNEQYILGITGEIGMGKSYVSEKIVEDLQFYDGTHILPTHNIDLDVIAHKLYTNKEPVYVELRKNIMREFGLKTIDRKELGGIVFNNKEKLDRLNSLIRNPLLTLLRKEMRGRAGVILLNGALLAEAGFLSLCNNNVIVVRSESNHRLKNLKDRGLTDEQIYHRINSQLNTEHKISMIKQEISKHNHGNCLVYDNDRNNSKLQNLYHRISNNIDIVVDKG